MFNSYNMMHLLPQETARTKHQAFAESPKTVITIGTNSTVIVSFGAADDNNNNDYITFDVGIKEVMEVNDRDVVVKRFVLNNTSSLTVNSIMHNETNSSEVSIV